MMPEQVTEALHRGKTLAAKVSATSESRAAWVGVYPLDRTKRATRALLKRHGIVPLHEALKIYRIRKFEVERTLLEADVWFSEDDLVAKQSLLAIGDDDLQEKLLRLGLTLGDLDAPFKSDYPL